jgi:HK97 gp10 family phage protein
MAGELRIDVDVSALLAAFDRLGPVAERACHAAARATAERVREEARARVRRATGQTASAITVDEAEPPLGGWRVYVDRMGSRPANLPIWIEFGTSKMPAQPFLFNSAQLEEGAHLRRIAEAIEDAIGEVGLGE